MSTTETEVSQESDAIVVPESQTPEQIAEVIEPMAAERLWIVSDAAFVEENPRDVVYQQNPMGAFQKLEFFGLLTQAVEQAMNGPSGFSLSTLIASLPDDFEKYLNGGDEEKNPKKLLKELMEGSTIDTMAASAMTIAAQIPGFLEDAILIVIGVPRRERTWAHAVITSSPKKGGWTDEEFETCVNVFIDQNAEVMLDFWNARGKRIVSRWRSRTSKTNSQSGVAAPRLSKRSSRSPQSDPSPSPKS